MQEPASAPLRVLLAEDNPVNAVLAEVLLARLGCAVERATDGAAAAAACARGGFDLVLMDMQMPGVDGLEATRRIRAREDGCGRDRLPIVALTASLLDGDRRLCLDAGMDEVLLKPVTPAVLGALVARIRSAKTFAP